MTRVTHDDRVLALLSDGQPHPHGEIYDLHVVAHSRVASLRRKGHQIVCWKDGGVYWYLLVLCDGLAAPQPPPADPQPIAEPDGQLVLA